MEFPDLGQHCSESACKHLDFLPFKCDACSKVFCLQHYPYKNHACSSSYKKDVQVPVCPLCNKPLPLKHGEPPDIVVGEHIDNDCKSDTALSRRKIFTNRCSVKGCKQKEMVKIQCQCCQQNFCLRHRHPTDHACTGPQSPTSRAVAAALSRNYKAGADKNSLKVKTQNSKGIASTQNQPPPQGSGSAHSLNHNVRQAAGIEVLQAGMSEDEALARALQASMADNPLSASDTVSDARMSVEDEDGLLARAIAESEREERERLQRNRERVASSDSGCGNDRCHIS